MNQSFDYQLDDYEKEILEAYKKGRLKRSSNFVFQKKKLEAAAKATLDKTKNINIRISLGDLNKVKSMAADRGLPYQTLISSLIHQYSHNRIDYNVLIEPGKTY